jgi:hypothetical protein
MHNFRSMKPETIARRSAEMIAQREAMRQIMRSRLAEKAAAEGPDSIWAEMLAEHDARCKEA